MSCTKRLIKYAIERRLLAEFTRSPDSYRLNLTYKLQFPEKDNYKLDGTTYDRYTKMESIDFRTENDAVKFLLELKNGKCLTCNMELRNYNGCVYKEGLDLLNDVIKKD